MNISPGHKEYNSLALRVAVPQITITGAVMCGRQRAGERVAHTEATTRPSL